MFFSYKIELVSSTERQIFRAHDAAKDNITSVQFTGLMRGTEYTVKITCLVIEDQCPGVPYTVFVQTNDCTGKGKLKKLSLI